MKFKEFKEFNELSEELNDKIAILIYLSESDEMLTESSITELTLLTEGEIVTKANNWLSTIGLKIHKGKGIIDYIKQFTGIIGKLILAAIKGDKNKVKEIASKVDKAEIMDFLLKLDMATLHIVTTPIHFIDAVTGWDLMSNLKNVAKNTTSILKTFYDNILKIKDSIVKVLNGEKQQKMLKVVDNLAYNMPNI